MCCLLLLTSTCRCLQGRLAHCSGWQPGSASACTPPFWSLLTPAPTFVPFSVQALATGQRICVDLAFSHLMLDQENKSMCKQLGYCWHANVRAAAPAHLVLTSVEVRGGTVQCAVGCVGCMQALWVLRRCRAHRVLASREVRGKFSVCWNDALAV